MATTTDLRFRRIGRGTFLGGMGMTLLIHASLAGLVWYAHFQQPAAPEAERDLMVTRLVSLGNQLDLTEADFLAPTVADPYTRVVAMYLEGIADGGKVIVEARRASEQKPLGAVKGGGPEGGRPAACRAAT